MVDVTSTTRLYLAEGDRKAKYLAVYSTIIGYPVSTYGDHKRPRRKTLVGYALLMAGDYVVDEVPIDYDGKMLFLYENRESQVQANLVCNTMGILRSIENLGNSLGFGSAYVDPANLLQHLCPIESIWIHVFPGTLLRVGVKTLPLDQCASAPPVPFQKTTPPSQGSMGDSLGDNPPNPVDGSGLLVGDGIIPSGGTADPFPDERDEAESLPGEWWEIVTYSNHAPTTGRTGDTNPKSIWTAGGNCHDGGSNNGCVPGNPTSGCGKTAFKNGIFAYCAHDPSRGNTLTLNFEFRPD